MKGLSFVSVTLRSSFIILEAHCLRFHFLWTKLFQINTEKLILSIKFRTRSNFHESCESTDRVNFNISLIRF